MFAPLSLFGGLSHGLEKGMQYEAEGLRMVVKAFESGDAQRLSDTMDVLKQQLSEIAEESGAIRHNLVNEMMAFAITGNHDPFVGSRHMLQDLENKYGKP